MNIHFTKKLHTFLATGMALALALAISAAHAAELIMVEQDDCPYCEKFLAEIGPMYSKTEEGKLAPLRLVDLSYSFEDEFQLEKPVTISPTFILIEGGKEVDRLVGYQGDEYFWFLLGEMLEKLEP